VGNNLYVMLNLPTDTDPWVTLNLSTDTDMWVIIRG